MYSRLFNEDYVSCKFSPRCSCRNREWKCLPTSNACGGTRSALVRTMTRGRGLAHPAINEAVFPSVSSISSNHGSFVPCMNLLLGRVLPILNQTPPSEVEVRIKPSNKLKRTWYIMIHSSPQNQKITHSDCTPAASGWVVVHGIRASRTSDPKQLGLWRHGSWWVHEYHILPYQLSQDLLPHFNTFQLKNAGDWLRLVVEQARPANPPWRIFVVGICPWDLCVCVYTYINVYTLAGQKLCFLSRPTANPFPLESF